MSPDLGGTFKDAIGLSLCGGIEVDVLKASASIVGLADWSVGPLYSAEEKLGCYEIGRLSDTICRLADMVADSIEVLSLGDDVTLVAGALRAPGFQLPPGEVSVVGPSTMSVPLLRTGLLALLRRRRKF